MTRPAQYWFVRHGESVANAEGWLAGWRDVPLTPLGEAQARALRETLREIRPARVFASDLRRASETAELAWEGRPPGIVREVAIRERHLGLWEGRPLAELRREGAMDALLSWDRSPPSGESHQALARRALAFLAASDDGSDTLIFAHGGWIRTVVGLLDGVSPDRIGGFKVANTELLAREVARGDWARLAEQV